MKLILSALVALALVTGYKAQGTSPTSPPPDGLPTDPTIKPATQCGQTALTCYTDESKNGGLNTIFAQLKFAEGCRLILVVMKCMDAEASKTECSGDAAQTDIETVRQWALNDIDDICNADGTETGCGSDAEDCVRNVFQVVVALSLHNITNTCPLFGQYQTCKDKIQAATECNTKVNAFLNQAEATMSEYQMLSGCEGKCAQHIGVCTVNSTAFSLDYGTEKYCSDAKSMIDCVNALKTNTDCKDTSDENQISEVDQAVAAQTALASDVCTDDYQVAPCATHLMECYTELIGMTQDKTISNFDFCKKASQFEECAGTAGCENQLKNAAQTMKGKIMVLEEKYNCANEGDCSDRLNKCAELAVPLESITKDTPKSKTCKTIKSGMDCLDVVKKDDTCIIERAAVQVIEDKFKPDENIVCGSGGGAAVIQFSVLLGIISLIVSFKNFV